MRAITNEAWCRIRAAVARAAIVVLARSAAILLRLGLSIPLLQGLTHRRQSRRPAQPASWAESGFRLLAWIPQGNRTCSVQAVLRLCFWSSCHACRPSAAAQGPGL